MPTGNKETFVRLEVKFPITVVTYEISATNTDGLLRTATGFSSKHFYYNKDNEVDSDGNLVLKHLWPAYADPVEVNKGV